MSGPPRNVLIVGRDAELWLTAATLCTALGPTGVAVTAVELPSHLGPASVYATLPATESLHARLGLEEAALLRAAGGSFSLGYNVVCPGRPPFFLAHGAYGAPIDGGDFFPFFIKARRFGLGAQLEDFSPTAMAARHGRMMLPDKETELFGRTDYAYHLPAIAYAAMLKSHAQRLGVAIHEAAEVGVEVDAGGRIYSVVPGGGLPLEADLFVDTSGDDAVLVGQAMGVPTKDWSAFFPFDRRLTGRSKAFVPVPSYADLRVTKMSWTTLYAAQASTYVTHAYRSNDEGEQVAIDAEAASGLSLSDIVITQRTPALRAHAWSGNCVAIGASACALDPLFDLDLHAVQLGIVHLLSLFPTSSEADAERAEYNRVIASLYERLRDFQAALYLLAGLSPTVPAAVKHKADTFRARGTIAPMEDETFSADQWRALFVGFGVTPESWPPAVDTTNPDKMKDGFRQILSFIRAKVLEQPTHDRYLADIGASTR